MARQSGNIVITGTIDNLCFYQMDGKFYVRMKSSLSGKMVKKDPAFKPTMYYAGLLGKASRLASQVYRSLPEATKTKGLYRQLTGKAMQWLKEGRNAEQVLLLLRETCALKMAVEQKEPVMTAAEREKHVFADVLIANIPAGAYDDSEILSACICNSPP